MAMAQSTIADARLVIEALGPKLKERFISDFVRGSPRGIRGDVQSDGGGEEVRGGGDAVMPSFEKDGSG